MGILLDKPASPNANVARDLAGSLPAQLDRAIKRAQEGSRRAFRQVTSENVDDPSQEAVTARVDRAGARQPLGAHAALLTATLGRHAVSRGTRDALPDEGLVTISAHGTKNPICAPIEGQTYPASGQLPPFHANCAHVATPAGFTTDQHVAAMAEARR